MKTNDLINSLAADLAVRPTPLPKALGMAAIVSAPIAFGLLFYALQVRSDFWTALADPRFSFKFVFTLSALAAGLWLSLRLSRPGTKAGPALALLGVSAALLVAAVVTELVALPASSWRSALIGDRAVACMLLIPVLSAAPLAALLFAMRSGAPSNPGIAGAASGLLAGAFGATLYASHCNNDSPLFVAVWYVIGIAAVTVIGSLIGSRVLRW